MKYIAVLCSLMISYLCIGQQQISHVEPPNWWYDMESKTVEIVFHGKDIGGHSVTCSESSIDIIYVVSESPNYLFVLVDFSSLKRPTEVSFLLSSDDEIITVPYSFLKKRDRARRPKRITASDAIYLITPDRFRNGNTKNDEIDGYKEGLDRSDEYGRHGGDLEGVIKSLDYISELGFNTVWLNPVLENDMKSQSYHGYATTDYYTVDKRYGGNKKYLELAKKLEEKNMLLVMDMIANHCGSSHWWMNDLPFDDWLNKQDAYLENPIAFNKLTNHRKTTLLDPYVADSDRRKMLEGWFVPSMPDLNQRNKHMSTYIIQNSIWWVETMNLAGIRQDTYSYPEEDFLSDWSCSLIKEFPDLFIVGEEWSDNPLITSYWQAGEKNAKYLSSTSSCLPSVMDFPLQMTINKALIDKESWNTGLAKMFEVLVNDQLYAKPMDLVIFPDNHDMSRIYTQLGEDFDLWKMAMVYYATMRGIPQIYYGTEVLMSNKGTESHGVIRSEMQGGWKDHKKSVFKNKKLSDQETEALDFTRKLYNWRKTANAIHEGKLTHYNPVDGLYVYVRKSDNQEILVVFNKNIETKYMPIGRFKDVLHGYSKATNVMNGQVQSLKETLRVDAKSATIFELQE